MERKQATNIEVKKNNRNRVFRYIQLKRRNSHGWKNEGCGYVGRWKDGL